MAEMLAQEMVLEPVDSLQPHPENKRRGDVERIGESIEVNGYYAPVVAQRSTRRILAGHHRLLAAQAQGLAEVPVVWVDVDDETALNILLADNGTNDAADWDRPGLVELLRGLEERRQSLVGTGFTRPDLDALIAGVRSEQRDNGSDPDHVPAEPTEPRTKPGDLWLLGEHRLLCGDAAVGEDYDRVLDGDEMGLCLTDPPYGVGIDYDGSDDTRESVAVLIAAFMPLVLERAARTLVTSGHTMVWLYPRPDWVLAWVEPAGVGRGPWGFSCTQLVLAFGKDPYLQRGLGSRPDTYIGKGEGPSSGAHPVAKPIETWRWFLERGSAVPGEVVLDPFGGSGTTLIAAQDLHRRARLIELSPTYCDVICARWQAYTGEQPVLASSGEAHDFGGS